MLCINLETLLVVIFAFDILLQELNGNSLLYIQPMKNSRLVGSIENMHIIDIDSEKLFAVKVEKGMAKSLDFSSKQFQNLEYTLIYFALRLRRVGVPVCM